MIFLLIGGALAITSVFLTIFPTKYDPEYPERKRRDWPVVIGLFAGGVVSIYVNVIFMKGVNFTPQGKLMRLGGMMNRMNAKMGRMGGMVKPGMMEMLQNVAIFGTLGGLAWAAIAEAYVVPEGTKKRRSASADKPTVRGVAAGKDDPKRLWDVTFAFRDAGGVEHTAVVTGLTQADAAGLRWPPVAGDAWPTPMLYDPANPKDATVRPPLVRWNDVYIIAGMAALVAGYAYWQYKKKQEEQEQDMDPFAAMQRRFFGR